MSSKPILSFDWSRVNAPVGSGVIKLAMLKLTSQLRQNLQEVASCNKQLATDPSITTAMLQGNGRSHNIVLAQYYASILS